PLRPRARGRLAPVHHQQRRSRQPRRHRADVLRVLIVLPGPTGPRHGARHRGVPRPFAFLSSSANRNEPGRTDGWTAAGRATAEGDVMPTRAQVEKALQTHFDAWNAKDRARWIANWHPDVVMQDPVGGPEKQGLAAVEASWDRSFQPGHDWRLE